MSDFTPSTEQVRAVYVIDGTRLTSEQRAADFDRWLSREREAAIEQELPCDGGCNYNDGPDETCSRHGRPVSQVWDMYQKAMLDLAVWADYFESWGSTVGAPPFTQEAVVATLRGPRPFGASQS